MLFDLVYFCVVLLSFFRYVVNTAFNIVIITSRTRGGRKLGKRRRGVVGEYGGYWLSLSLLIMKYIMWIAHAILLFRIEQSKRGRKEKSYVGVYERWSRVCVLLLCYKRAKQDKLQEAIKNKNNLSTYFWISTNKFSHFFRFASLVDCCFFLVANEVIYRGMERSTLIQELRTIFA